MGLSYRLFGHNHLLCSNFQVHLGIWGQGGGRNLETLAPGSLFTRPSFPFHTGPCSAGKRFAIRGVKAPRTWPESAVPGTFLGEAPGAFWVPVCGKEETPVPQGEPPFQLGPVQVERPGTLVQFHSGLTSKRQGSGALRGTRPKQGRRRGKLHVSLRENTFLTELGLLKKEF